MDSTLANEHGGERARATDFDLSALIKEFRILKSVLINKLKELSGPLSETDFNLIHMFIDDAIQKSATSFSLIQAGLREQLIATLSHDMRSPLTASSLAAETILKISKDEKVLYHANKIKKSNRRIDGMIQDILDTTLIGLGGKLQPQFQTEHLTNIIKELEEYLPGNKRPKFLLPRDEITVFWDKEFFNRALENLITNAFKYGDASKEVTVKIYEKHGRVITEVHNFGTPIPKEELETIFQIFRRAEAAKQGKSLGWGLGLPMARAVAEAHGGSLAVNSFEDQGTTFIVDIPQNPETALKI